MSGILNLRNATTRRHVRGAFFALLAATVLAACGSLDTSSVCILGPCTPRAAPQTYLLGLPIDRIDRSIVNANGGVRGALRVGESVRLIAVRSLDVIRTPPETLRVGLTWELRDSMVAGVTADAQGAGRLEARAPGVVGLVLVNGFSRDIWSCDGPSCWRVGELVVTP